MEREPQDGEAAEVGRERKPRGEERDRGRHLRISFPCPQQSQGSVLPRSSELVYTPGLCVCVSVSARALLEHTFVSTRVDSPIVSFVVDDDSLRVCVYVPVRAGCTVVGLCLCRWGPSASLWACAYVPVGIEYVVVCFVCRWVPGAPS